MLTRTDAGGRKCNRIQRSHAEHHKRLVDDFVGTPAFSIDGVVLFSFTNYLLKTKTLDALWENNGSRLRFSMIDTSLNFSFSFSFSFILSFSFRFSFMPALSVNNS